MMVVGFAAALTLSSALSPPTFVADDIASGLSASEIALPVVTPMPASGALLIAPPAPSPVPLTMFPQTTTPPAANPGQTDRHAPIGEDDILVTGRVGPPPGDPFEAINEEAFKVTQVVDENVVGPTSRVYRKIVPLPVRDGLGNLFRNLHEPSNFVNFILQHKFGKAGETVARFVINSTLGIAGLFDMAKRKPFRLTPRFNSLANTLGFYGIGPGPFFFLPGIGPTTARDAIGNAIDGLLLPQLIGKPFNKPYYTIPSSAFRSLEHRVDIDGNLKQIKESPNPYAATRDFYLLQRQAEIDHLKGKYNPLATGNSFPGGMPASPPPTKIVPPADPTPEPAPPKP